MLTADGIGEMLGMAPVPIEGGRYAQTWRDELSTGIYYLMTPDDCSGLHALPGVELWSYHAGAPAKMLLLYPDGRIEEPILGPDLAAGQRPQIPVHPGIIMAAEPLGDWSLLGTFMAPPFDNQDEKFVDFCSKADLLRRFPAAQERINRLGRAE